MSTEYDLSAPTTTAPTEAAPSSVPDTTASVTPPASTPGFLESLPEGFGDKEWAKNFAKTENPVGELAKAFENAQSLIGKKAEGLRVPGEGATPEDWANFHKAIGVPESADKYEYAPPEVPEDLKGYFATDDNLINAMKEVAIKAGVRPEGFKLLAQAFDQYYLNELRTSVGNFQANMQKIESDFKAKFGERSNQVLDGWKNSYTGLLGKEEAAVLDALDPTVKVALAAHHEAFAKKYIREGNLNMDVATSSPAAVTNATEYGNAFEQAFAKYNETKAGTAERAAAEQALRDLKEKGKAIFGR